MNLKTKLAISVAVASAAVIATLSAFTIQKFSETSKKQQWSLTLAKAEEASLKVKGFLDQKAAELKAFSSYAVAINLLPDQQKLAMLKKYMENTMTNQTNISDFYVVFDRGKFFSADSSEEGKNYNIDVFRALSGKLQIETDPSYNVAEDDDWYVKPAETRRLFLVEPYKWQYVPEEPERMMVTLGYPLIIDGNLIGVVGMDIELQNLVDKLSETEDKELSSYSILVSNEGLRAAHPKKENWLVPIGNDMTQEGQRELQDSIRVGKIHRVIKNAIATNSVSLITYVPMIIEGTKEPWSLGFVISLTNLQKEEKYIEKANIIFSCAAIVALTVIFFFVFGKIFKQLFVIGDHLEKVTDGDLTVQIPVKNNDEIGQITNSINKLIDTLRGVVTEAKTESHLLEKQSKELYKAAESLTKISADTENTTKAVTITTANVVGSISAIAQGADLAGSNANEVASSAEQMSSNINTVAAAIEEMSASVGEISSNAKDALNVVIQATSKANEAQKTMGTLGSAAKEIGTVTDVIKKIADKTNLLALNATIEAASAGEAGKGFAVVAAEIKELANQSAQSADDIAQRIEGIQTETNKAIKVIGSVTETIAHINSSVAVISDNVTQQTTASNEIANNVSQASVGVRRVASSVTELAKISNDVARNAGEAANGANEVSTSFEQVSRDTEKSASAAAQVETSTSALEKTAQKLQSTMGKFKI